MVEKHIFLVDLGVFYSKRRKDALMRTNRIKNGEKANVMIVLFLLGVI